MSKISSAARKWNKQPTKHNEHYNVRVSNTNINFSRVQQWLLSSIYASAGQLKGNNPLPEGTFLMQHKGSNFFFFFIEDSTSITKQKMVSLC
jgi:hypothetical protein